MHKTCGAASAILHTAHISWPGTTTKQIVYWDGISMHAVHCVADVHCGNAKVLCAEVTAGAWGLMACTTWWSDLYITYVLNAALEVGASRALLRLVPVPVGLLVAALECATHTMHGPYACPAVHTTVALCVECSDKHRTLTDWYFWTQAP